MSVGGIRHYLGLYSAQSVEWLEEGKSPRPTPACGTLPRGSHCVAVSFQRRKPLRIAEHPGSAVVLRSLL